MTDTPGKRFDGTSLGDDAAAAQHGERSAGIGYAGHDADLLFRQSSFVQGAAAQPSLVVRRPLAEGFSGLPP